MEANRRFTTNKDISVYPLFYSQDAAFWFELDTQIMTASHEKSNLDDFIGRLFSMDFPEEGTFRKRLPGIWTNNTALKGFWINICSCSDDRYRQVTPILSGAFTLIPVNKNSMRANSCSLKSRRPGGLKFTSALSKRSGDPVAV